MYKYLITILLSSLALTGFSQDKLDRSKAPKAGPAPVITINDPAIITLPNGITVIVVENHKLPKVAATLSIDRGPIVEGSKAGVNNFMGQMLGEGTTKTPKDVFDEKVDQMGANVNLFASGGAASALSRYFESAFLLMSEAIQYPAFPQESFEKIKSQTLTSLKSNEKSASAISARVVNALAFGKNSAQGEFETEETIKSITLKDIKTAYKESITPSRCYITFVGDITPEAAKALVIKAFGNWKGKKLSTPENANVENVHGTEINFVNIPTAVQGEITVSNLINNPLSNPDYHALAIANQILGGGAESKLFMNLREKHGFTYGSYSRVGSGRFQTQFTSSAQVRSEKADSAIAEIMNEISNMREGKITKEELDNAKAKYNGSFALGMEDPERTASYASNILINNLPKDYYRTFLQKINAHLSGQGCPNCNESKGEKFIKKYLLENDISFIQQYKFKDCKDKQLLPFDFYLTDLNICIEFNGRQHYEPISYFGGIDSFKSQIKRDNIKKKYCVDNIIYFFIIKYDENIKYRLDEILK